MTDPQTTRRDFFARTSDGLLGAALTYLLCEDFFESSTAFAEEAHSPEPDPGYNLKPKRTHHSAKATSVIQLFMNGGPSQMDLFDPKPTLIEKHGTELPEAIRRGQRLTAMSGNQASLPLVGSPFKFAPRGQSGVEISDMLPHISGIADDL